MDAMVDIVKKYAGSVSEIVVQRIAEYIATGKGDEVFKGLPPQGNTNGNYYVTGYLKTIRKEMTPEDLPRFRNMMPLLQHMNVDKSFVRILTESGMTDTLIAAYKDEKELFRLIASLFAEFLNQHEMFYNIFESLYKHDPAMLTRFLPELASPHNYLLRYYMLKKDENRYKAIEEAFAKEAKKVADDLLGTDKSKLAALKNAIFKNKDDSKMAAKWLFGAFVPYGVPGKIADIIKQAYAADPLTVIACMGNWQADIMRDKMLEMGMDLAPFFANYANNNKTQTAYMIGQVSAIFSGHNDAVKRALSYANVSGKALLYFYLTRVGEAVDAADLEKIILYKLDTDKDTKKWLAEGGANPKWLTERTDAPVINSEPVVQLYAGGLLGKSDMAARYTQALLFRVERAFDVQTIFENMNKKYVDVIKVLDNEKVLKALSTIRKYYSAASQTWDYIVSAIANNDPALYKKAFASTQDNDSRVYLAMCLPKDFDVDFFIELLGDKSKKIRDIAFNVLKEKPELKDKIAPLVEAKKKDVREYSEKLLMYYSGEGENNTVGDVDIDAFYKKYGKNVEKALEWTNPQNWPKVREADSDKTADETIVKYYVYQFLNSKTMELPPNIQVITQKLNALDRHALALDIYSQWINAGGETKRKGALLLFGVNADNNDVVALRRQIEQWAESSRGAIAAEAVKAMALSGQDLALMQVDSMANKFKNKQVRKAAKESFALAASAMGLTAEQLADRIIPDLGFDQRGEKEIDFGARKFTAFLTPALAVELKDEAGKQIKSLPKPGAKDDEAKANVAKAEFTTLKKSLKTVVTTQAARLENALSSGRSWTIDAWEKLFVKNPIMHSFAMGLIWGFYKDNALVKTFRYMDDGSLSDVEDENLSFADYKDHTVGLVHPLELTKEEIEAWKGQLEDYEITQPLAQLHRPVFPLTDEEKESSIMERFGGVTLPGITLINKLVKMGWDKGSVQDGGAFYSTYKEFPESGIGVQLNHSYLYVMLEIGEDVKMGEVAFYHAGTVKRGSYVYDEPEKFIPLKDLPAKLFSEVVYNLDEASKTSTSRDKDWKNDRDISFF